MFDELRLGLAKDRSQFYKDFAVMFYGANRADAKVSQGMLDQFWLWSMQGGLKNLYDSIKAFSETDFHEDLRNSTCPRWSCTVKTTKSCRSIFQERDRPSSSRELRRFFTQACRMASPPRMRIKSTRTC